MNNAPKLLIIAFGILITTSFASLAQLYDDVTASTTGLPPHSLISLIDVDSDGDQELLVGTSSGTRLWKRTGAFSFEDITSVSGLDGVNVVAVADFDNDGFDDILHISQDRSEAAFYDNLRNGTFNKVSLGAVEKSALALFQENVTVADVDQDGDLDLVFGIAQSSGGAIAAVLNGGRYIYPDFPQPFSGVSILVQTSWTSNRVSITDANGDGRVDLLVTRSNGSWPSDTHQNHSGALYLNTGTQVSDYINTDGSKQTAGFLLKDDAGLFSSNEMSDFTSWDIDGDGDIDLINGSSDWPSVSRPHIYVNDGAGNYQQLDSPIFQSDSYYHHAINLFDADLDNDLDAVWVQLHNFSDIYPRFWRNDGNIQFADSTTTWGITARIPSSGNLGSSGYHADLDGDADLDFVTQLWGAGDVYAVYRNNAVENSSTWLRFRLSGRKSPQAGIGARIEVTVGDKKLVQLVANSAGGIKNNISPTFGLNGASKADLIRVYWPSGLVSELRDVVANQTLAVTEEVMIEVRGGTLPPDSQLAGQTVDTFRIGKFEATLADWWEVKAFGAANGYDFPTAEWGPNIPGGLGARHPIQGLNWYDSLKFCNAKSEMEGLAPVYRTSGGAVYKTGQTVPEIDPSANGYRLPTEAEWEWAARGGVASQGYVYSGSNNADDVAWCIVNKTNPFINTRPVGTKSGNELGLHDMSGNAMEWCWRRDDGLYPLRGGNWGAPLDSILVTARGLGDPAVRGDDARTVRLVLPAVASSGGNLLVNGSFENSAYMPGNTNTLDPSVDGWSGSGNFQVMANGLNYEDAHQGQKSLVFNAGERTPSGSIEQTVAVLPSETYFLSFWLMHHGADSNTRPGTVGIKAEVLQNGAVIAESSIYLDTAAAYNIGQWYPFLLQATSAASTMTVRFTDISTSGALRKDIGLDSVSLRSLSQLQEQDSDNDGLTDAWELGYGRYQIVEGNFTWQQAKADAQTRGGHLATVTSHQERTSLLAVLGAPDALPGWLYWLGASENAGEGSWAWVTEEDWSYTDWVDPEPNGGDSENYLSLYGLATDGRDDLRFHWNDLRSWAELPYILEFGYPTDPFNPDSDGDGYNDKLESDAGTDPNDGSSTPMVTVQGGTLPQSSGLAGTTVSTFSIGKYEVTWREWQEVRVWAVDHGYSDLAVGAGSSPNDPVRLVNQFDLVKWCNARSEKEGLTPVYLVNGQTYKVGMLYYSNIFSVNRFANGYRLPTEAEWEWAARGGVNSQGFTYSGSNDPDLVAWHRGNSSGAPVDLSEGRGSWPVGSKLANELGLHDMSGNVWEIVSLGGGWTFNRDERGGGWNHDALLSALAFRDMVIGLNVDQGNVDSGFRVVRSLDLLPPDADNDGVNDYRENADGTNPNDANSFNPLSKGLVAHYPLNGESTDESGYQNHAVNLGAEATTDRFGANSSAFSFDGVGDYMDAPPLISDYQRNFTFSGWIKTTHVSSDRLDAAVSALCKTRDAGDFGGPAIDFREGKAVFTFNNNRVYGPLVPFEEWEHVTGDLVADGNWRHYIMSIDANGLITAFINGQQVASHQIATFLEVAGASPFQIGRAGGAHEAGRYFPGQIDEVRIYNRGLTGAEARQIYQSEAANLDSDNDGLLDIHETQTGIFVSATDTGSDPYDSDSSDDGLLDGEVVTAGFDPNTSYTPLFNLVKSKSAGDQARIGLFTESAMIDLNLGGIVLRKSGSTVNLRLQIQSKTDLKAPHWTDEGTETFILDMPGNKAFMRIRALGPQ